MRLAERHRGNTLCATAMGEHSEDRGSAAGTNPPVTAVASRRVKRGREREFEEWVSGILAAANEFPGYLGSEVLRPGDAPGDDEYRIVFRFDRESNLRAWEISEERRRWLRKAEPLIHEERVHVLTGLETWFTLPWKAGEPSPPRYKMALVTWLAVFPLITVILVLFGPLLGLLPMLLRTLVLTAVMVSLMTYVVMPRLTRLFSFWLYPDRD
jgi:antibiotic biosynthesis monooxygenase (ABM) superfamily enzyme